jgi:integrase
MLTLCVNEALAEFGRHPGTCPVKALTAWLELAGIDEGAIFRGVDRHGRIMPGRLTDRSVARIVQRSAQAAGLDPALYAGHSLRAGLATSAAMAGAEERDIMRQTRHKSVAVARRYIRDGSLFRSNAAAVVGL